MKRKPHKTWDCPCTPCCRWSADRIAELTAKLTAARRVAAWLHDLVHSFVDSRGCTLSPELCAKVREWVE